MLVFFMITCSRSKRLQTCISTAVNYAARKAWKTIHRATSKAFHTPLNPFSKQKPYSCTLPLDCKAWSPNQSLDFEQAYHPTSTNFLLIGPLHNENLQRCLGYKEPFRGLPRTCEISGTWLLLLNTSLQYMEINTKGLRKRARRAVRKLASSTACFLFLI